MRIFTGLVIGIFTSLLTFSVFFIDMPRIIKADGYTSGAKSVSKVLPQAPGVLTKLFVSDRTSVISGDVLGEVTTERFLSGRSLDGDQAQSTERKLRLDTQELSNINEAFRFSQFALEKRISSDVIQLSNLDQELKLSRQRLIDLERQLSRQIFLEEQGFVSPEAVEQKRNELVMQKISISALERNQQQLESDLVGQRQEVRLNETRAETQRSLIKREIEANHQELNEHLARRLQLVAPIDGIVTQVAATVGQVVRPEVPLLTIVPTGGVSEVVLLVPSKSIGFVRVGQRVSVRYQAYPYEHYGRHWGVVKEVAQAALPPQEVVQQIRVDEPVYTVRLALPGSYLEYQGRQLPLTPGMVVEADVELDRLKIYQWLLEPLYRLGARV